MVRKVRNTTAEDVFDILKKRILNLQYKPSYPLSAFSLSEELEVSRSPVREAQIRLAAEGLVEIFPQIGTQVSLINLDKVSEERFLRRSLEEAAIRSFVNNPNASTIASMQRLIDEQQEALKEQDIILFLQKDDAFHEEYFKAINKLTCWKLSLSFTSNEHRLRLLSLTSVPGTQGSVIESHRRLLGAITQQDEEQAVKTMREHLGRISNEISKLITQYPEIFTYDDEASKNRYPRKGEIFPENFLDTVKKDSTERTLGA